MYVHRSVIYTYTFCKLCTTMIIENHTVIQVRLLRPLLGRLIVYAVTNMLTHCSPDDLSIDLTSPCQF